jgi:hypothetical protein
MSLGLVVAGPRGRSVPTGQKSLFGCAIMPYLDFVVGRGGQLPISLDAECDGRFIGVAVRVYAGRSNMRRLLGDERDGGVGVVEP